MFPPPVSDPSARRVAASKIPVVTVTDSGHAFSEDDPEGFGHTILQLIQPWGMTVFLFQATNMSG
jgi:hypothetical protein